MRELNKWTDEENKLIEELAKQGLTTKKIAQKLGIDVRTLQNYKLLADMIPELSDLVDTGIVTKTTAPSILL